MDTKSLPGTLIEAVRYFSDLDVCRGYLAHQRWPDGITCPACASPNVGWLETRKMWKCRACKKQFSAKVGTIFEDSPIGLDKWLVAMWAISSMKNGISSHELARTLGVTQKTAWFMLHRIRMAMKTKFFQTRLSGEVEADETFIGGKISNRPLHKRGKKCGGDHREKTSVVGMLQRGGDVRAFVTPNVKGSTVRWLVRRHVDEGTNLYTDEAPAYQPLDVEFQHSFVTHAEEYVKGRVHTNGIENFWSLLKRGLKGTYIQVAPEHLHRYLDEQVYRFNTRKESDLGRFTKNLARTNGKRLTYRQLTGK
jgi:transposase-like protein